MGTPTEDPSCGRQFIVCDDNVCRECSTPEKDDE